MFPERAVIFYELGDLYFITKSYQRSESNLKRAIDLEANNFWFKEKLDDLIKSDFYEKNNIKDQIKQLKNQIDCGDLDPFNAAMQVFNNYES